jgi:hypothetical protein
MIFRTRDLPFASFLHATRALRFLGCQRPSRDARIEFAFDDPDNRGACLQLDFEAGAECSAVAFYDSVRHLRRVMDGTKSTGASEHVSQSQHSS